MPFVTTDWLAARLGEPELQVIDGSWYLPTEGRRAAEEFRAGHIPGALFLDIDALSDRIDPLPHMLLTGTAFGAAAGAIGIDPAKTLVIYDGAGLFSAPRVWWMLRHYGLERVYLLAGGFPKWRAEGNPVETGPARVVPTQFNASSKNDMADLAAVRHALDSGAAQVVDARSAARFRGDVPEPRPGVRAGHMPGSLNLPYSEVLENGQLKDNAALSRAFASAGVDLERPVITSCGSGVTAAILCLALHKLGKQDVMLYDGSWSEYGSQSDLPVTIGPRD